MKNKVYYKNFHISGFTYYDGPLLVKKLKLGTKLKLKAEPENRYDENAVAVYYKSKKIGFIPKEKNYSISKLLNQGHNPFYVVIQQVDKSEHPERQYRAAVYLKRSKILKETKTDSEIKGPVSILKILENTTWLWDGENDEQLIAIKKSIEDFLKNEDK